MVIEWVFNSLYAYIAYDESKEPSHSMCIWNSLNLENTFSQTKLLYLFNPWFNHILLYVVDLTNRQCTLALRYFRSCFRCVSDIQSSLVLWLQPSLPITKFISISWKMTPHLTCSSNQELGVIYIVKYKIHGSYMFELWTIHINISYNHYCCTELSTQCSTYFSQADELFFSCFILNSFKKTYLG